MVIADRHDATLHTLYVVDSEYGTSGVVHDMLRQTGTEAIEAVVRRATSLDHPPVETITAGIPYKEILSYSEDQGIDLVVLGTHGRTGIDRVVMGSVAERIIRTARTSVLTVRPPATEHG